MQDTAINLTTALINVKIINCDKCYKVQYVMQWENTGKSDSGSFHLTSALQINTIKYAQGYRKGHRS